MARGVRLTVAFAAAAVVVLGLWYFGFISSWKWLIAPFLAMFLVCGPVTRSLQTIWTSNMFGLTAYALVCAVFFYLPQVANLCWEMPYVFDENGMRRPWNDIAYALGFGLFLLLVFLFFFSYWLMLLKKCGFDLVMFLKVVCVMVLVMMFFAPGLHFFWQDHFGGRSWSETPFKLGVIAVALLYFCSWFLLLRPAELVDAGVAQTGPFRSLVRWLTTRSMKYGLAPAEPEATGARGTTDFPNVVRIVQMPYARFVIQPFLYFFASVNLSLFMMHSNKCGWVVDKLNQWANERTGLVIWVGGISAVVCTTGFLFGERIATLLPFWHGVLGFNLLAPAALALWVAVHAYRRIPEVKAPGPIAYATGSILSFLVTLFVIGELLWLAPQLPIFGNYLSYRNYTIWAVFQLGFTLIAAGTWLDLVQREWLAWPTRLLAIAGAAGIVFVIVIAASIDENGEDAGTKLWQDTALKGEAEIADSFNWYKQVSDRLKVIEEKGDGPIVIVSASGGGSRAALFTALVLDGLSQEPFPADRKLLAANLLGMLGTADPSVALAGAAAAAARQSWADRILFISSVSGGSLATANFSFAPPERRPPLETLRNSLKTELAHRFHREFDQLSALYEEDDLEKLVRPKFADILNEQDFDNSDADIRSIFGSASADDMCTDFMAPILRGTLSLRVERGKSLSRFWQSQFDWRNPDDRAPYHNLLYSSRDRPLIVLNATNAKYGSRVMLGFPQLPRRLTTMHRGRVSDSRELSVTGALKKQFDAKEFKDFPAAVKRPAKLYTVQMSPEFTYTIDMKVASKDSKLDPYLYLYPPDKPEVGPDLPLAHDDNGGGFPNARIASFQPKEKGAYRIYAAAFQPADGEYTLTVKEIEPAVATVAYDPNRRYPQSPADFAPTYQLTLPNSVRASANFPFGFVSGSLGHRTRTYNFAGNKALRRVLAADKIPEQLLDLLPAELDLLDIHDRARTESGFQLDGRKTRSRAEVVNEVRDRILGNQSPKKNYSAQRLNQIAAELYAMAIDPHAQKQRRTDAKEILDKLNDGGTPSEENETNYLLDGGVNDNSGVPTLLDLLTHVNFVASPHADLVSPDVRMLAVDIIKRLRERGVIFLEIDSGQRPTQEDVHELNKPLAALENAGDTLTTDTGRSIVRDMNRLIYPRDTRPKLVAQDPDEFEKRADLPWMLSHQFLCNLGSDSDAVTAWSLGPQNKAHVMATYFCELQKFRKDTAGRVWTWQDVRDAEMNRKVTYVQVPWSPIVVPIWEAEPPFSIRNFQSERYQNELRRIKQKTLVQARKNQVRQKCE